MAQRKKSWRSDSELSEVEFLEKYASPIVTDEYLKARYAWTINPCKETWLASVEAYRKTEAFKIHYPQFAVYDYPHQQLNLAL
jgi:hypothetical protein